MEQNLTARSYIVTVYRIDTEDRRKITGLVKALDGSGEQEPFRDADELALLLNRETSAQGQKVIYRRVSRGKKC